MANQYHLDVVGNRAHHTLTKCEPALNSDSPFVASCPDHNILLPHSS